MIGTAFSAFIVGGGIYFLGQVRIPEVNKYGIQTNIILEYVLYLYHGFTVCFLEANADNNIINIHKCTNIIAVTIQNNFHYINVLIFRTFLM